MSVGEERHIPNTATVREQRRRKTKAQLIDELETLEKRSAANEAPHGSGSPVYDSDDRLLLCNKTYQDIWGYSDSEAMLGVHWDDLDRLDIERSTVIGERGNRSRSNSPTAAG